MGKKRSFPGRGVRKRRAVLRMSIALAALVLFLVSCSSFSRGKAGPPASEKQGAGPAAAEKPAGGSKPAEGPAAVPLDEPLPVDPAVKIGVLGNGLTYYIRANRTPEKRAEIRLVVNAGSVLEDDDQLGLAHFLEHMAFNGTESFERQAIVDYLESIGMRFGPELNAYTSYEETVYMLAVPTDREDALPTAVHILDEWASRMTLDEGQIDKERGVIVEEWRLRRDAATRIWDAQAPFLFYKSRYAERAPIGKPEIIETFPPGALERFYRDWYRPDLVAVVAVGDFDPAAVELLVREHFEGMETPLDPRPLEPFPVPDHAGTLFSVVTDREATESRVSIYTKYAPAAETTVGDYRNRILESLFHGMLNARLDEIARGADSPFAGAYSGSGRIVRTKEVFVLGAQVREGGIARGLGAVVTEAERVRRHGFTAAELDRQKRERMSAIESAYNERDKIESGSYADEYASHYLDGEPIPGIEFERRLHESLLPGIALEEVNALASKWLVEDDRVVLASAPAKEGVLPPSEGELRRVLAEVSTARIEPYREDLAEAPLMAEAPAPGRVEREKKTGPLGITEWTLSNGARVVLKPTDFKNDQVLFGAYSPGGHSIAPDEIQIPARTAADVVVEGGLGPFNRVDLEKKLAGKVARAAPWIDELYEGFEGSSTPADLETMLQLVHLYFTRPRRDEAAFTAFRERLAVQLENRESSPEQAFWDGVRETLAGGNPRAMPIRSGDLVKMDLDASFAFYNDRFSDAGDFIFFFVGAFDTDRIKPLVEKYLASLPSGGRKETWRDLGIRVPSGTVRAEVRKGIEPKSTAVVVWGGPFSWSLEKVFTLNALASLLDIPLRESLREEQGGVYSVFADSAPSRHPVSEYRFYLGFGTSPEQVDPLIGLAFDVVRGVRENGPREADVDKVREILRRERETNLKRNEFWSGILRSYSMNGLDFKEVLRYDAFLEKLSAETMRRAARTYLPPDRYVQVVLYPEG